MTSLRRHVALVLALAVAGLALAASPAGAGAPLDQLRLQVDRVLKVLDDAELKKPDKAKDRRVAVRKIANEIFDFSETAKRSLGRHWQARTPASVRPCRSPIANGPNGPAPCRRRDGGRNGPERRRAVDPEPTGAGQRRTAGAVDGARPA